MSGEGPSDPRKPVQISVFGKKGSGKTELAYRFFDTYPGDRGALDPNNDLKMPDDTLEIFSPIPSRWPGAAYEQFAEEHGLPAAGGRKRRSTLYFAPDAGEDDHLEEIDRFVGLAFAHRKTCLFFTECHEGCPVGKTPPHMRRALRHGRHAGLTLILDTPRPHTIDPLVVSQSDYVFVFKLPSRQDRQMIADNIGWDVDDFHAGVRGLGPYEYLRYDAGKDDLAHFPALPESAIKHHTPSEHEPE
jgi:hypothetical protein